MDKIRQASFHDAHDVEQSTNQRKFEARGQDEGSLVDKKVQHPGALLMYVLFSSSAWSARLGAQKFGTVYATVSSKEFLSSARSNSHLDDDVLAAIAPLRPF